MGILRELNKVRGGWPGGWKQYARGMGDPRKTPPFVQPEDPDDRRSLIPGAGLKEYWYPALPDKDVGWKKPVGLKIVKEDLVFFRGKDGQVKALWDYCPHRGAYLSWGDCFWKGFVSCPYHGATFDGEGECVEFITEGPDSKMVGRVKAKSYPTLTLKGIVFVWMGESEPVDPHEDIPPEFFEGDATIAPFSIRYWDCNWMIALENQSDSHNAFYVHRNALRVMFSARGDLGGRPRTPLGYQSKLINNKAAAVVNNTQTALYYADESGNLPYKMYYPRVGGYWPLSSWRMLWVKPLKAWAKARGKPANRAQALAQRGSSGERVQTRFEDMPEDWKLASSMRLPGMQRLSVYTRWCVPVDENLTRVFYVHTRRIESKLGQVLERVKYRYIFSWLADFNFSDQDYDAMRSCRWQYKEYLSATDSHVIAERRLVAEHARGLERKVAVKDVTSAEAQVVEGHELLGVEVEDYGQIVAAAQETGGAGD